MAKSLSQLKNDLFTLETRYRCTEKEILVRARDLENFRSQITKLNRQIKMKKERGYYED